MKGQRERNEKTGEIDGHSVGDSGLVHKERAVDLLWMTERLNNCSHMTLSPGHILRIPWFERKVTN